MRAVVGGVIRVATPRVRCFCLYLRNARQSILYRYWMPYADTLYGRFTEVQNAKCRYIFYSAGEIHSITCYSVQRLQNSSGVQLTDTQPWGWRWKTYVLL